MAQDPEGFDDCCISGTGLSPLPISSISFLFHFHYARHESLETAFSQWMKADDDTVETALNGFIIIFSLEDVPARTRKHIAAPFKKRPVKD